MHCWRSAHVGQTIKSGQSQRTGNHWTESDMVQLSMSASEDGLRLESTQKGSQKILQTRGMKAMDMATLRRQSRPRTALTRQDRGSCSSTSSCPVFSGPYSDREAVRPLRRLSSPVYKGSFPSLQGSKTPSSNGSCSSLQGSVPCLQGSLPSLQGTLPSCKSSLPNLGGSVSQVKRRSLGSLENSSCSSNEWGTSLQRGYGSSSDDDGSWDTNSWSSGATCLLRTPVKQASSEASGGSNSKICPPVETASSARTENELIYQNIVFSRPADNKRDSIPRIVSTQKDTGILSVSSSCMGKTASSVSSHDDEEKAEDRRKFSQFLNEVTGRVLKSNGKPPQQSPNLRHHSKSTPPSTLSHQPLLSAPTNPTSQFTAATNSWYSPTSSNLQTIREYDSKDITSSIQQWSKMLPSCKVLEPEEMLRKVKQESHCYPQHLKQSTKFQTQSSAGRLYLETDIDKVRRLDELVINGTLGKDTSEAVLEKVMERGKDRGNRIPWERNGGFGVEKGNEKKIGSSWERDRGFEKSREKDKVREGPCWEQDRRTERGREKEKKAVLTNYESPAYQVGTGGRRDPCPVFSWPEGFPRMSYRSTSLPRTVNTTESDGETRYDTSTFHDHKDDLRKRLSYTTHKLEMVETEFDATRQYLETELRRAQEELEKFTEKLRRIQSGYAALQRINQDLEDKMCRMSQHHEEEKRALSREIILLNNHLMEAKITINKLREDNDLYRKDCNLAAQLLQCSKSHHRTHKLSELPLEFQERISSYLEKHNLGRGATVPIGHTNYPDEVPTAIIAKVLEKPEPGSSSPKTCSLSPHQDGDFLIGTGTTDHLNRRISNKTSDLYCSDTALYCPERWQDTERRQSIDLHGTGLIQLHAQNSIESNPDEDPFQPGGFSHHEPPASFHHPDDFGTGSLPVSSSYSSFSLASDEKGAVSGGYGRNASSTLSSSHQGLYMDWRDGGSGDYERKSMSSYEKDSPSFSKSHSIQQMAISRSPPKGSLPLYTRTASCLSEPYHSSSPRLASSHSKSSTGLLDQAQGGAPESRNDIQVPEDDLSIRWKQLSVEDMNTFSSSYRNVEGRISPYSFSERHFAMSSSSKVKESLYSSFQEGDDVFHSHVLDQCFGMGSPSPTRSPKPKEHRKQEKTTMLYRAKNDSQDSESSLFLSGSSKDKESSGGATAASSAKKDYMNLSVDSSGESLHHSSLEASSLQHYPSPRPSVRPRPSSSSAISVGPALPKKTSPRYQKFGSTGLTRKDSLTKAQLYGTLLN